MASRGRICEVLAVVFVVLMATPCHGAAPPIFEAVWNGNLSMVDSLLTAGADPNAPNDAGILPLGSAAYQGHLEIARLLIQHGAILDQQERRNGTTALIRASERGYLEIVTLLLAAGCRVDRPDNEGWTALIAAADNGQASVVRRLLKAGASATAATSDGRTALHAAAHTDSLEMLALLVRRGAAINCRMQDGRTPLHWASFGGNPAVLQALLALGAKATSADSSGVTCLHVAAGQDHADAIRMLLEAGAPVSMRDHLGRTPLVSAAQHRALAAFRSLLNAGASEQELDAYLADHPEVADDFVPDVERLLALNVIENGAGARHIVPGVEATDSPFSSLTISASGPAWALETEFPSDQIPQVDMVSRIFGDSSIHRFRGEVRFDNSTLPIFHGDGERDSRLTFLLQKSTGYIYLRGRGSVEYPDGRVVQFGGDRRKP